MIKVYRTKQQKYIRFKKKYYNVHTKKLAISVANYISKIAWKRVEKEMVERTHSAPWRFYGDGVIK